MTHWHHIIPRSAGGKDDPENLIEVSVEEHARIHHSQWILSGRWQDYYAWRFLTNQVGKEERLRELSSMGGKIGGLKQKSKPKTPEQKRKMAAAKLGRKQSPEHIAKKVASIKARWEYQPKSMPTGWKCKKSKKGMIAPEYICSHCGKVGRGNTMFRHHFDNCKEKNDGV